MRTRFTRNFNPAQHARQFVTTAVRVQRFDTRVRGITFAVFAHAQMRVSLRSHLRQVRHAQHLATRTQCTQFLSDDFSYGTANTSVHFVEDHAADGVFAQRRHFDG